MRARQRTRAHRPRDRRATRRAAFPTELAARIAALDLLPDALDIAELAARTRRASSAVAEVYDVVGDRLRLDWLDDRIVELPRADRWDALARNALREDVVGEHRAVADAVLRRGRGRRGPRGRVRRAGPPASSPPSTARLAILDDIATQGVFDLATLSVALRELRALT